jgi:hypothetical protein
LWATYVPDGTRDIIIIIFVHASWNQLCVSVSSLTSQFYNNSHVFNS